MTWYQLVLLVAGIFIILLTIVMLQPLRIFVYYYRENKDDRLTVTVKLFRLGARILLFRNGHDEITLTTKVGRREIRIPVYRKEVGSKKQTTAKLSKWEYSLPSPGDILSKASVNRGLRIFRGVKPLMKRITWSHFELEAAFGLGDPALAGLAAGGGWAIGGAALGLLQHYFTVDTVPRINIVPMFYESAFKLRWEGELSMPLHRWAKLLLTTRKIGGAARNGQSSH